MPKRRTTPPAESFLYGRQAVREALRAGRRQISQLQLASGLKPTPIIQEIRQLARQRHLPIQFVDRRLLDEALGHSHHQGVLLQTGPYPYASLDDMLARADAQQQPPFVLLLDRVQDPQNLGSLLRTAEACAVHGIIIPKHRAAAVTPAVVNASAGAVEHLFISRETNLVNCIKTLKQHGLWLVGLEKHPDAVPLSAIDWQGPLGIVVGSEGFGLGRLVREHCDWLVALPMQGQINSLNAAVAGSIVVFWAAQARLSASSI